MLSSLVPAASAPLISICWPKNHELLVSSLGHERGHPLFQAWLQEFLKDVLSTESESVKTLATCLLSITESDRGFNCLILNSHETQSGAAAPSTFHSASVRRRSHIHKETAKMPVSGSRESAKYSGNANCHCASVFSWAVPLEGNRQQPHYSLCCVMKASSGVLSMVSLCLEAERQDVPRILACLPENKTAYHSLPLPTVSRQRSIHERG